METIPELENNEVEMSSWDVYLDGELLDTVICDASHSANRIKRELIREDGYPNDIEVALCLNSI
jgi:hypothetical protein